MKKKLSNKEQLRKERRDIYKRMMKEEDPEKLRSLASAYGDNVKATTPQDNTVEIVKIIAIAGTGVLSAATQIFIGKMTLSYESQGKIFSKLYPYKGDLKMIKI